MELPAFSQKDELLFNMANRKFPVMSAAELDIQKVFTDVLPMLQAGFPDVINVFTYVDGIRYLSKHGLLMYIVVLSDRYSKRFFSRTVLGLIET